MASPRGPRLPWAGDLCAVAAPSPRNLEADSEVSEITALITDLSYCAPPPGVPRAPAPSFLLADTPEPPGTQQQKRTSRRRESDSSTSSAFSQDSRETQLLDSETLRQRRQRVDALGEALKDRCQVAGNVPDGEVPAAVAGKLRLAGDTDSPGMADVLRRQRQRLVGSPATPAAHATVTAGPRHSGGSSESADATAASAEMMETELPCGT